MSSRNSKSELMLFDLGGKMKQLAGIFSLALLLAACGGASKASGDQDYVNLDEQIGLEGKALLARQTKAEQFIQGCMRGQGFGEYVAADPAEQEAALVGGRSLTEEEFNQQYGYGITTLYEQRLQQTAKGGPNQAFTATLDGAGRMAFNRALYGDDPTATLAEALDSGDFTRLGGCTKQAADAIFGGTQVLQDLTARLDQLDQAIQEDVRMAAALKRWSQCMNKSGYDLAEPDEVDTVLQSKLEDIVGPLDAPATAAKTDFDRDQLKKLQAEERSMVADDIACEDKHVAGVESKVRQEYEDRFRQDNSNLLERVPPIEAVK